MQSVLTCLFDFDDNFIPSYLLRIEILLDSIDDRRSYKV